MKKMKKIMSFITIIAMLSSVTMFSVNAAAGDVALTAEPNSKYTYTETFDGEECTVSFNSDFQATYNPTITPDKGGFIGSTAFAGGFHNMVKETGADENTYVVNKSGYGAFLKISDFFKGKKAGTYSIKFDAMAPANSTLKLKVQVQDLKNSISENTWKWVTGANSDHSVSTTEWTTITLDSLNWDGTVYDDTNNAYDECALVLRLSDSNYGGAVDFKYDNFEIISPEFTAAVDKTSAKGSKMAINNTVYNNKGVNENGVVITALYDAAGSLVSATTAKFAITASETSKVVPVLLNIPSDVTSNYTYKSFVWSDLTTTIEPLTAPADVFDASLLPNGSFEILPKTEKPTAVANDNIALGWKTYHANYPNVLAVEDAHTGKYGVEIQYVDSKMQYLETNVGNAESGTNIMGNLYNEIGFVGKWTLTFWAKVPSNASVTPKIMFGYNQSIDGTACWGKTIGAGNCVGYEGAWCKYEVVFDNTSAHTTLGTIGSNTVLRFSSYNGNIIIDDVELTFTPAN